MLQLAQKSGLKTNGIGNETDTVVKYVTILLAAEFVNSDLKFILTPGSLYLQKCARMQALNSFFSLPPKLQHSA